MNTLTPVTENDLYEYLHVVHPIKDYISVCSCLLARFISNFHLSIARRLPKGVYFKALTRYAHKSFQESFVVSELLLLRRRHQYDKCKTVYVLRLQTASELYN